MTHHIQIQSYTRGCRDIVTIPVPYAVQTKYDNMSQNHNLHLVLRPSQEDKIEVGIWSNGFLLEQHFCAYENDPILSTIADAVNFADVPKLLKLCEMSARATNMGTGRVQ